MVLFLELLYPKSMKADDLLDRKAGKSDGLLKKKRGSNNWSIITHHCSLCYPCDDITGNCAVMCWLIMTLFQLKWSPQGVQQKSSDVSGTNHISGMWRQVIHPQRALNRVTHPKLSRLDFCLYKFCILCMFLQKHRNTQKFFSMQTCLRNCWPHDQKLLLSLHIDKCTCTIWLNLPYLLITNLFIHSTDIRSKI